MDFKRPSVLIILISFGVFVLCSCFIWATSIMSIFASLALAVASGTFSILAIKKYINYKKRIAEMRYQDAYLFAEEKNDLSAIDTFSYSTKTERHLRADKFQQWLKMFSPVVIFILSILLILISFRIVFS